MARSRRITIVIPSDDARAIRAASRAESVSQSEIIRRGIRAVTAAYRREHPRPRTGLFRATRRELADLRYGADEFGDLDE